MLNGLDNETRHIIYNDTMFGMNSSEGMSTWIAAGLESLNRTTWWTVPPQTAITKHFAALSIDLNATFFNHVLGNDSVIRNQINALETKLVNQTIGFVLPQDLNSTTLAL